MDDSALCDCETNEYKREMCRACKKMLVAVKVMKVEASVNTKVIDKFRREVQYCSSIIYNSF